MTKLRFAVIGCGFWSHYQVAAWFELEAVELVAVCDKDELKANALSTKFGNPMVYTDAEIMFKNEKLDFVDIISSVNTHKYLVTMAALYKVNLICQKPMADNESDLNEMMSIVQKTGVKAFIHENFRFQAPVRKLKEILDSGTIGTPFKANLRFCCSFPIFDYQPVLKELKQFIIADLGVHILDLVRFCFGEVKELKCKTQRINPAINGEDVANIFMEMQNGLNCYAEMSYASILENERFPQTFILIEGDKGSVYLGPDGEIRITTKSGTTSAVINPVNYTWVDPAFAASQASAVETNRNLLQGLNGGKAETTFEDNYKTVKLVFDSYSSAETGKTILY